MFDNYFLESSNQMKLCTIDYIFPIKQDDTIYYNPLCFMSSGFMLDNIIMVIFTQSTKKSTKPHQEHFFPDSRMIQFTCKKNECRILHGKGKIPIQKGHYVRIITLKFEKPRKHLSGILYIEDDKIDLGEKMDHLINDKSDFNNTHIIKSNIQPVSNIPE